jgi:hypothetical protein
MPSALRDAKTPTLSSGSFDLVLVSNTEWTRLKPAALIALFELELHFLAFNKLAVTITLDEGVVTE